MRMKLVIDDSKMKRVLRRARLSTQDMLDIEYSGSRVIVNRQRERVPVDTAATKVSIESHIEEASAERVVDEIGPETDYGPYLEYGTGKFAESGRGRKGGWFYVDAKGVGHFTFGMKARPFVRPSVLKGMTEVLNAIKHAYVLTLGRKWQI